MEVKNYYELLGVEPKANLEEIKHAYREKIKIYHPDKNKGYREEAIEMTQSLNTAYEILSDTEKRMEYDRMLNYTNSFSFENIDFSGIYESIKRASPQLGQILEEVMVLFNMLSDGFAGKYVLNPFTFGTIAFALVYLFIPFDFLPDFLIFLGLTDDIAILSMVIGAIQGEMKNYKEIKDKSNPVNPKKNP